jgi:hypothetical protein
MHLSSRVHGNSTINRLHRPWRRSFLRPPNGNLNCWRITIRRLVSMRQQSATGIKLGRKPMSTQRLSKRLRT